MQKLGCSSADRAIRFFPSRARLRMYGDLLVPVACPRFRPLRILVACG